MNSCKCFTECRFESYSNHKFKLKIMKKYLIGFVVIAVLHLVPYLLLNDKNMLSNIELLILIPDILIIGLVVTAEDKK